MIAPNSIASTNTIEPADDDDPAHPPSICTATTTLFGPASTHRTHRRAIEATAVAVAAATAGAFRDLPRRRRGSERQGSTLVDSCLRTKKCTESVSPSSSSPDRPSPKRLPGGRAFNLGRSVLGALGKVVADSAASSSFSRRNSVANCDILDSAISFTPRESPRTRKCTQKCTEAGAPSSGLPTDRRRSGCLSGAHQPPALRPRCTRDTRASTGSVKHASKRKIRSLRTFLYNAHTLASSAVCST